MTEAAAGKHPPARPTLPSRSSRPWPPLEEPPLPLAAQEPPAPFSDRLAGAFFRRLTTLRDGHMSCVAHWVTQRKGHAARLQPVKACNTARSSRSRGVLTTAEEHQWCGLNC